MPCAAFIVGAASNTVGALTVDYLVKPIERRLRYLFCFNNVVQELQEQEKSLNIAQTQLQGKVDEAKLRPETLVIEEHVKHWLKDAENVLKDVEGLNCRIQENKRCFCWCLHWSWRYQLSKDIEQKTKAISELVRHSSNFDSVGRRAPLPGIEFFGSQDYLVSKSAISAFDEIMKALKDDGVNIIGLCGMGGVGKTTLVREVGKKAKSLLLFDRVIIVVASQTPDINKIQQKIADFLDLELKKATPEGHAEEILLRLEKEKKVLIILDDLWNELDLEEIGISFRENRKGCKIIVTTRRKPICKDMKSRVTVSLGVLDEAETWNLFKMKASLDEEKADKETIKMAREVAKECKGLPVAIVTLARALKDTKTAEGWEVALRQLQRSRLREIGDIEEQQKNAYTCLKMSYDYLKTESTKRCFLLCALFPEDHSIDVENELVRYAWGLELYHNATSIEEVRTQVVGAIDYLKHSSLLLEDGESYIKVHDVVRDVALWIASEEDNGLVKPWGRSENESYKENLEILLVNHYDVESPIEYFEGMRKLKVLSLKMAYSRKVVFFSLNALKPLTNLRALQLKGIVRVKDISALAKLTKLQILSLSDITIEESMDRLGKLKDLRVLELHCCIFLAFTPNFIRGLHQIEELYLVLREHFLESLCELSSPSLERFPEVFVFPCLKRYTIDTDTLRSNSDGVMASRSLRISGDLPLNAFQKILHNVELLELNHRREITGIKCLANRSPGDVSVAKVLQNIKYVKILRCENLQVIFQMENAENHEMVLSKLKFLQLTWLPNLECIWKMPTKHLSLGSLETIKLFSCGKLTSLFSFSLAQSLACLEKLMVIECEKLVQIVEDLEGDEQEISLNLDKFLCLPKLRTLVIQNCDSLEYMFPNLKARQGLQQLQELSMDNVPQLKQIRKVAEERVENGIQLPQHQLLLSLRYLKATNCPEWSEATTHLKPMTATLEEIQSSKLKPVISLTNTIELWLQEITDHNLIPEVAAEGLNQLTLLRLLHCQSLEYLVDTTKEFVPNTALSNLEVLSMNLLDGLKTVCNGQIPKCFLQNLKELRVIECYKLEEVFQIDKLEENQPQILSNLEILRLHDLPELRWILKGSAKYFSLRSLKDVSISSCMELKSLFSSSVIQSLEQLEGLKIKDCKALKTLFAELESDGETESNNNLHPLCLPRLTILQIYRCGSLQYVFPITLAQGLRQLELFEVEICPQLKQVFGKAKEHVGHGEHFIELPCLKELKFLNLRTLSNFGPESYPVKAPVLKDLSITECPQLKNFSIQKEVNKNT